MVDDNKELVVELLELDFEKSEATFKIPEGSRGTAGKYLITALKTTTGHDTNTEKRGKR